MVNEIDQTENSNNEEINGEADGSISYFDDDLDIFIKQIDSLALMFPVTQVIIELSIKIAKDKIAKTIKQQNFLKHPNDDNAYLIPLDQANLISRFEKLEGRPLLARKIVPRTLLVALVSQSDAFIGNLAKSIFRIKPEILNASEKQLTLSQIIEFGSIESAKEFIVEKEVETILRKSHTEQFEWFEKQLGIPLRSGLTVWSDFIEITERRNLFVHTDAKVSSQYIQVCNKNGCSLTDSIIPGKELIVDAPYFDNAFCVFFEVAVKLTQVVWRKLLPDENEAASRRINDICLELINEEKYNLAISLLEFAMTPAIKHPNDEVKRIIIVNLAQSYKWSGEHDKCNKLINQNDWSSCSDKFKMAKATLTNDFSSAVEIFKRTASTGDLSKSNYRNRPLFRELRNDATFAKCFNKAFGEPIRISNTKQEEIEATASSNLISSEIDDFNLMGIMDEEA